jgi:hypothetical protein
MNIVHFNISKCYFEIFGEFLIKGFDLFYVISRACLVSDCELEYLFE